MTKMVEVEKEIFEAVLRKMVNPPPAPKSGLPKLNKKLARLVELITR